MINQLQLIRNVGRFDSVNAAANIALGRLTLIYAENGRGKTTLAAILRSLATGDAIPIVERRRLAAQHPPHVIIGCAGGPPAAMFQNGAWNRHFTNMVVFDDVFIDQNVYSGLVVGGDHRQNLHELILGAQGVALNEQLQNLVAQVEVHNRTLRQRESAIPAAERGAFTVDQFCALQTNPNVAAEIQAAERNLAAAREQDPVRITPAFESLSFPAFDLQLIESVLKAGVPELDAAAATRVQEHLATSGRNAEEWIGEGMRRQAERPRQVADECVFCAQDLAGSPVIGHYRAFFSDAYRTLQRNIAGALVSLNQAHHDNVATSLERSVRILGERRQFWARFAELSPIQIDTAAVVRDWLAARDHLSALLTQKRAAPLDVVTVPNAVRDSVRLHEAHLAAIAAINQQLARENETIAAVKQRAANANPAAISSTLSRLKAVQARHSDVTSAACAAYLAEKQAKAATELLREQAKAALDQYRANVFPNYQAAINRYLTRFNAGYHLDAVTAVNTRGGPACTYNVIINNTAVAVAGGDPQPGDHAFKNTLSAGDRNALALAFFFASIELDPNLATKAVVIDDPVSSLDEHRSLTTVQEIRRLSTRVAQVIVLSHSKPFLCRIWEGAAPDTRVALHVVRDGNGSTIDSWNVDYDSITEHDRRDAALRNYMRYGAGNDREIAQSLRPHIEAFLRVACPEHFPPGTLLGPFRGICDQRVCTPQEILNAADIQELRDIVEYANRFHHDTNAAWQTEVVNSGELAGFVARVLAFVRRH
jgi:wobble nucleotide-excising tRNase